MCRVPGSASSAAPWSPSLVASGAGPQRVVVSGVCFALLLRRADCAARLLRQGSLDMSLGWHLVAEPPSFPMPFRRAQDVRQRETKRGRCITRRRVRNATSLVMSTRRQGESVERDQSGRTRGPVAHGPACAIRCDSPVSAAPVTLDWGPCGANPKCNLGLRPSAASG